MLTTPITPLDEWVAKQIGAGRSRAPSLTLVALERWQDEKKSALVHRVRVRSPFYRSRLPRVPAGPCSREQWEALPFTTADDLRRHAPDMLCVSQGEVSRVTTLPTSGTSGMPKRIFFTGEDLERTVDFFHHGMSTFTKPGQRVLVFMPGELPDSIGDLLSKALPRMGCEAVVHGLAGDPEAALEAIHDVQADVIVGLPVQVLAMARHPRAALGRRLCAVLLSADHISQVVRQAVEQAFVCPVFAHWGMTETGYGGGVECAARRGYHLRGADLLVEIIDPVSGRILPDGLHGEVVISTLIAQAMPLLRYRTGDLASLATKPCPCGCRLPRLGPIQGRLRDQVRIDDQRTLSMAELDEILLTLPWLSNYRAALRRNDHGWLLDLEIFPSEEPGKAQDGSARRQAVETALNASGLLKQTGLRLRTITLGASTDRLSGPVKRSLQIEPSSGKT
ncbi:DVU_1553 family AMP-dependent CoA ligase [Desulfonatronum sp. SC1]|uniref:DVU_1553 family AMP-dependent CoA ligase n=1 Tax=Desulfonatronum sp. SC1 TaxID=2109626 RepID=UPI000D3076E9|nr:AMP-binding protein [Desulfonatronum sp. SC1]PTN37847.1 AMP-dependent synthetase [Desulfonatronum sp. SC1]